MEHLFVNGGVQYVPQIAATSQNAAEKQIVYLDFDGETTGYRNEELAYQQDVTFTLQVEPLTLLWMHQTSTLTGSLIIQLFTVQQSTP